MIVERRAIIFPRADFLEAVRIYAVKLKRAMPADPPETVAFDPAVDDSLVMRFEAPANQVEPLDITFTPAEVGAALIGFCRDQKIPLPRTAIKKIEKHRDGAALLIEMKSSSIQVMVVDDQQVMRSIVRKILTRANIQHITEATDGRDALAILDSQPDSRPDLIICDLHMEKMDGIEFLKTLRGDRSKSRHNIPVLILTGDKNEKPHQLARQAGATRVLTKPISPDDLVREIRRALGYVDEID